MSEPKVLGGTRYFPALCKVCDGVVGNHEEGCPIGDADPDEPASMQVLAAAIVGSERHERRHQAMHRRQLETRLKKMIEERFSDQFLQLSELVASMRKEMASMSPVIVYEHTDEGFPDFRYPFRWLNPGEEGEGKWVIADGPCGEIRPCTEDEVTAFKARIEQARIEQAKGADDVPVGEAVQDPEGS